MKPIVLAFAFFAAAPALWAQATALRFTDPDRREALEAALPEIERIFDDHRRRQGIPGVAFGVVIDGDLVLAKGLGVRNVASDDPVTPDTVFRIASMTKSFTALAILKLRDEGKLSLEDPAAKWIPELADLTYPTRQRADPGAPPAHSRRGLARGQSLGRPPPRGQ